MTADRSLARGDVVLARFPFTDLSAQGVRPALIVGRVRGDDLVLAFVTSRTDGSDPEAEHVISSDHPEFRATGLKVPSTIRLNKVATLHRRLAPRRLGRIGPEAQRAVDQALRYVFDL